MCVNVKSLHRENMNDEWRLHTYANYFTSTISTVRSFRNERKKSRFFNFNKIYGSISIC